MRDPKRIVLLLLVVGWSKASTSLAQDTTARFRISDIFRLEALSGPYSFSSDGKLMAFVVKRPINAGVGHDYIFTNDRADVWIYDRERRTATNLTNGIVDRADFWYPMWSPGGGKLAMVSNRGATRGYSHVWIWNRSTGSLSQLSSRYVDIENDVWVHKRPYNIVWLSDSVIAFPTLSNSMRPAEPRSNRQAIRRLTEEWAAKLMGLEPTAVVFESGVEIPADELGIAAKYSSCNVRTGECRDVLGSYVRPIGYDRWGGSVVVPSPSHEVIAVLEIAAVLPRNPKRPMPGMNANAYRVRLFKRSGELVPEGLDAIKNIVPGSLRWSPDGSQLALVGSLDRGRKNSGDAGIGQRSERHVLAIDVMTGGVESIRAENLELVAEGRRYFPPKYRMVWTGDGRLVLYAKWTESTEATEAGWWLLEGRGGALNLTARLGFVPDELYPVVGRSSFLCAGNGNLWLVFLNGDVARLTSHPAGEVIGIVWTDKNVGSGAGIKQLVYRSGTGLSAELTHFDLRTMTSHVIRAPDIDARFATYSATGRAAVFVENDRGGTRVWVVGTRRAPIVAYETNTFLRQIAAGQVKAFRYQSLEGDSLVGWLLLPVKYKRGRRYPLVTWVYQGAVMDSSVRPRLSRISTLNPLNLQTLASNGYAVLFPSMPGGVHDYTRLLNGVMPAVDRVIALGIADPRRLAVMGQSNGGFSTYGLITLTDRFDAAVALAGLTDLFSISLQFPPGLDKRERIALGVTGARLPSMEWNMGSGLPWRSAAYRKNSPISYVDQVETPILQLHGDFDGVPIQQAEEFFTALQRLGKRAKFVRYIGEDHVFQSPANIKHSWKQILMWLEDFLVEGNSGAL